MSGPGFLVDVFVPWPTSFFARNVSINRTGVVVRLHILNSSSGLCCFPCTVQTRSPSASRLPDPSPRKLLTEPGANSKESQDPSHGGASDFRRLPRSASGAASLPHSGNPAPLHPVSACRAPKTILYRCVRRARMTWSRSGPAMWSMPEILVGGGGRDGHVSRLSGFVSLCGTLLGHREGGRGRGECSRSLTVPDVEGGGGDT